MDPDPQPAVSARSKHRKGGFFLSWLGLAALAGTMLVLATCAEQPAALEHEQKLALVRQMQHQLETSVEAEKSAVLSTTDGEAVSFADESKRASGEVEAARLKLHQLAGEDAKAPELNALAEVDARWSELQAIDARLLTLAVENTNLKAARLSAGHAAAALDRLIGALTAIGAASSAPDQLRTLAQAQVAALQIQTLHAPHIASPSDAEMTAIEGKVRGFTETVDRVLAVLDKSCPRSATADLATAHSAWAEYLADNARIFELSRANSNVHAFDISVHEKREATKKCETALAELAHAMSLDTSKATR